MEKLSEIKLKTKELLLATTCHGIQNIIKTESKSIKVMWLICIALSACFGVVLITETIVNYFEYEVVTSIKTVYEERSQFPAISICSPKIDLNYTNILSCTLYTKNCTDYFQIYKNVFFGQCLRFNGGKNVRNESVDILYANFGQISSGLKFDISFSSIEDINILYLNFHNASLNPFLQSPQHILYFGGITSFQIERIIDEKLDEPFNNCIKEPNKFEGNKTIIDHMLKVNPDYTQYQCIIYFIMLKLIEKNECDCHNDFNDFDCKNATCMELTANEFIIKNIFNLASNYCPIECNTIKYILNVNSQSFPSSGTINSTDYYPDLFKNFEDLHKKLFRIKVYYEDLEYTYIKQKPKYEVVDVISSIGGTLGLFLGLSFLSFIEIFELFFEILNILIQKKKVKTTNK